MLRFAIIFLTFVSLPTVSEAATWFLPDWQSKLEKRNSDGDGGSGGGDPTRNCASYGYQSSCPGGQSGEQIFVTSNLSCYKSCYCDAAYRYNRSNCQTPYFLAGESCNDGSGEKYKDCILNTEEACKNYVTTCPSGWQLRPDHRCPYDNSYGTCCNLCAGYDYVSIPEGYVELDRCDSCSGIKYKIKVNPCSGYSECRYGAAAGSLSCQSGSITKYQECKPEPKNCPTGSWNLDNYWCSGALKCWIK